MCNSTKNNTKPQVIVQKSSTMHRYLESNEPVGSILCVARFYRTESLKWQIICSRLLAHRISSYAASNKANKCTCLILIYMFFRCSYTIWQLPCSVRIITSGLKQLLNNHPPCRLCERLHLSVWKCDSKTCHVQGIQNDFVATGKGHH